MINAVQTLTGNVKETGIQGLSAYEVYKKNGGTLSEEEWLASLKGEKGEKGDTGEQGVQGIQGEQGIRGEKGDTGEQGPRGDAGSVKFIVANELPSENIEEDAIYMIPNINGINWNGDTTGKEVIAEQGMNFYKVSDKIMYKEDLIDKTMNMCGSDGSNDEYTITISDYAEIYNGTILIYFQRTVPAILVVTETTDERPYSTGIYFLRMDIGADYTYVSTLSGVGGENGNTYQEYIYVNGAWESLGGASVEVDLSNYPTKKEMDSAINEIASNSGGSSFSCVYEIVVNGNMYSSTQFSDTEIVNKASEIINDANSKGLAKIFLFVGNTGNGSGMLLESYTSPKTKVETYIFYPVNTGSSTSGQDFSITGNWSGGIFTCKSIRGLSGNVPFLTKDNTTSYTPTANYHPATKKYVDNSITNAITTTLGGSY